MSLRKITFKNLDELKKHIQSHEPTFYFSSQTSTVIPYDKLEEIYKDQDFFLGNLSQLPSSMELSDDGILKIEGPVNWQDAKAYLRSKGHNLMTAPTENLALISSGAATSATGERCFHFGTLRSQITEIKYLNHEGVEITLAADQNFGQIDADYNKEYAKYSEFKNAPFPRFEKATDLLIGTEGQLGVITELSIKTTKDEPVQHLFMLLPKWEEDNSAHIEACNLIQNFRDDVIVCEFIDSNSFSYLPKEERPNMEMDALFFEIKMDAFERFYEDYLQKLSFLDEEQVFELTETKFQNIRASIPRAVFEANSHMGVVKKGTDVQVSIEDFKSLLNIYKEMSSKGIKYNLFGHFGDAHLHFNFMPTVEQEDLCQKELEFLYKEVIKIGGSPFAEHGIGILKQKYITDFWTDSQYKVFKNLKSTHDPHNQFFPQGFMNLAGEP